MSEEVTATEVGNLSFKVALMKLACHQSGSLGEQSNSELEQSSRKATSAGVALLASLQKRLNEAQQKVTVLMGELEPENDDSIDTTLS